MKKINSFSWIFLLLSILSSISVVRAVDKDSTTPSINAASEKAGLRPRKLLPPTTIDIFLARLEIALDEKDHDHFMCLFSWTDSPANARTSVEKTYAELTAPGKSSPDIDAGTLPFNYKLVTFGGGYKYEPNIKPEGVVRISFPILEEGKDTGKMQQYSLPFGKENGEYRFITLKQTKINWSGPPDKSLNFSVLQCGITDKLRVRGYYIYNMSGTRVREEFDSYGGFSKTFSGQYVEECAARVIEGKGAIRIVIRENGEDVYGSPEHNSSIALTYKRDTEQTP